MRFPVLTLLVPALLVLLLPAPSARAEMEVYFAPNGGFAPINRNRAIVTADGRQLAPTLNNAVRALIDNTRNGGKIKIAMYAFTDRSLQEELIRAAFQRNIKVKVILDGVAEWTVPMRSEFIRRVKRARRNAPPRLGKNFQVKVIQRRAFRVRGRTKYMKTGQEIYGTMHEKFGVFYQPGQKIPFDCFAGSSNISVGSDQKFAENRFVFKGDPTVARQFAEEFARLWNEYGVDFIGNAESEVYIPADPVVGGVKCIFNGEPIDEESNHEIDSEISATIRRVSYRNGTIDIFMFSFTHWQLCQQLLELAQRFPTIRIRILMDQTQVVADEEHRGILGPYMEKRAKELGLANLEIRYKWRSNVFFWEEPEKKKGKEKLEAAPEPPADPTLDGVPGSQQADEGTTAPADVTESEGKIAAIHWRNLILHHKVVVVDRKLMVAGSYNWSSSAERRNLENVMVFNAKYPGHKNIIDRMMAEFDLLWNSVYKDPPFRRKITRPQVVSGDRGRELTAKILSVLSRKGMKPIMTFLDRRDASMGEIVRATGLPADLVRRNLQALVQAGILFNNRDRYGLSD